MRVNFFTILEGLRRNLYILTGQGTHRSSLKGSPGLRMPLSNTEMIEKLKMAALRRCEERIAAARTQGSRIDSAPPQFGVSVLLKHRHGL